jgi:hypothetical protein
MSSRLSQLAERRYGLAITERSNYYIEATAMGEGWGYKGVIILGEYDFKYIRAISDDGTEYKSDDYANTWSTVGNIVT